MNIVGIVFCLFTIVDVIKGSCNINDECDSRLCLSGRCAKLCERDSQCIEPPLNQKCLSHPELSAESKVCRCLPGFKPSFDGSCKLHCNRDVECEASSACVENRCIRKAQLLEMWLPVLIPSAILCVGSILFIVWIIHQIKRRNAIQSAGGHPTLVWTLSNSTLNRRGRPTLRLLINENRQLQKGPETPPPPFEAPPNYSYVQRTRPTAPPIPDFHQQQNPLAQEAKVEAAQTNSLP